MSGAAAAMVASEVKTGTYDVPSCSMTGSEIEPSASSPSPSFAACGTTISVVAMARMTAAVSSAAIPAAIAASVCSPWGYGAVIGVPLVGAGDSPP
jgi:hypothetical protein